MADIVGLLASILQLVATIKTTRDYVQTFFSARKQRKLLLVEIGNLEPLLKELDGRIRRGQARELPSGIQEFEQPLIQLKTVMERLEKKLHCGGKWNFTRLTWSLWGKQDVQEGLNIVERFKGLVLIWLELDIWDFTRETAREYHNHTLAAIREATEEQRNGHDDIFKSVREMAQHQEQCHSAAERDVVIEWYSPLNFFLRQADIFGIHQPGTGQWFLEANSFNEWKSGVGKVLWCRGMPGAGKTVLVSIAVQHLRATEYSHNVGVAAVYLNHKETDAHTASTLLTSLWRQLVVGKSIASVENLYQKHREPGTKPSLNEDHAILCSTISQYLKVFILVDALDEYPERKRDIFMSYLSQLGTNVNLLLTSRPHISLKNRIPEMEVLEIEAREEDIRCHIDAQILKSPRLSNHIQNCPDLLGQIEDRIVRRSDGMFLMAKLHIDSLSGKHTVKAVQNTLKNLPNNLESTYDDVLERINRQSDDDKDLAWRTLSWISHAKRLLRPSELRGSIGRGARDHRTGSEQSPRHEHYSICLCGTPVGRRTRQSAPPRPLHSPTLSRAQAGRKISSCIRRDCVDLHRVPVLQHVPKENGQSFSSFPQAPLPGLCSRVLPRTRTRGSRNRSIAHDYLVPRRNGDRLVGVVELETQISQRANVRLSDSYCCTLRSGGNFSVHTRNRWR
ncbi:Ankyrin [Mycena sanguinolenta]|uniref:Ankyrin n=1 Tax=Mycena sanguinolenta TaxID=230812 RepID=A0A8H7CPM6_9AGAR|nr:Ankyrin [Mycena sanguinolenta]